MADNDVRQQIMVERLPSLLRDIYEGKLLLPAVAPEPWDDERRVRLFERIYQGLPIGGITVWRTSLRVEHCRSIGSVPLLERGEGVSRDYLVDGLGWVVTLFAELGTAFWLGDKSSRRQPILSTATTRSFLAFELETQTFRSLQPGETLRPTEFALQLLFDAETQHVTSARLRALKSGGQWANQLSRFIGLFFDFSLSVTTVVSDNAENGRILLTSVEKGPTRNAVPRTSLWYCDVCRQPIRHATEGVMEWLDRVYGPGSHARGLRLVHHASASPLPQGCRYNKNEELQRDQSTLIESDLESLLGADGLTHLLALFLLYYEFPEEEFFEIVKRLHTPGYERARFHAQAATTEGVIEPQLSEGFYWQDEIARVLEWADAKGLKP